MKGSIFLASLFFLAACGASDNKIRVSNPSDLPMTGVVVLDLDEANLRNAPVDQLPAVTNSQGEQVPVQLIDDNQDGVAEQLALMVSVAPGAEETYRLMEGRTGERYAADERTYCRFVPERMDDFAWENDKVAFRVYGPACQKLFEEGKPGGLISSGIDCWLKRVEYPIIDKWYAKNTSGGSYHEDEGEGLDNFHVGTGRGAGGTAIRHNGKFVYSENYSEWEILANGPLRSVFRLKYKPVLIDGHPVTETKTITIDLGNHFFRCDVSFDSPVALDTLAIGLTLHDNLGVTDSDEAGWISYWEPIDDSEIGMGAWVKKDDMLGVEKITNAGKDNDHIWLYAALKDNKCTYYAGFGWKKANEFTSEEAWKRYLSQQVSALGAPLEISAR